MGSCVSVHKHPESAANLPFPIESKDDVVLIPSPAKERTDSVNGGDYTVGDVPLESQLSPTRFVHAGSKDEAFFDSQPWLDSDCEDDFLSVNGDFTPSRGNTPVHHNFSSGYPWTSNGRLVSSVPEPSPSDKKTRLSDLFEESLRNDEHVVLETRAENQSEPPSNFVSVSTSLTRRPKSINGERTPKGELGEEDGKAYKFGQCCLPSLISNWSFNEWKTSTPAQNVG